MRSSSANPEGAAGVAANFASFVENFELSAVPDTVIAGAKLSILDAFGIALASTNYEFAKVATAAINGCTFLLCHAWAS